MLEQDGKILVVALVITVIVIGIGIALFVIDNRLRKAEKKLRELEKQE